MLRFIRNSSGENIPFTPNEIMEIKQNLPTIIDSMPGSTSLGEFTKIVIISQTQISITFLQRKVNRELRITLSKIGELLYGDDQFLPESGNFVLEIKDDDGNDVRINKSSRVEGWIRIQCPYLILEDSHEMLECLWKLLCEIEQSKDAVYKFVDLNKIAIFKREYFNPNIFSSSNSLKINVSRLNGKAGEQRKKNEGLNKLFFQITKGNRVLFSFSELYILKVIEILKVVI
jgi:hypothetical protein